MPCRGPRRGRCRDGGEPTAPARVTNRPGRFYQILRDRRSATAHDRPGQARDDGPTPGKTTLTEQLWEPPAGRPAEAMVSGARTEGAAAGPGAPIQRKVAPVHDETTLGSQAAKIDWSLKAGKFSLDAEAGMADKSLYEVFLAKFKEQLAKLSFKGETYEQIIARRDKLAAEGNPDSARGIDEELWRARTYAIIETLKVETSKRYQKEKRISKVTGKEYEETFCNVYAYDLVTALGAYLPRVWWMPAYLSDVESGAIKVVSVDDYREAQKRAKQKGQPITPKALGQIAPIWAETTQELSANMLADWFNAWGAKFGWRRTADMHEAQSQADGGKVVVISASKKDTSSGHVDVVIPQDHTVGSPLKAPVATKIDPVTKKPVSTGQMGAPLQSQAGGSNFKYGVGQNGQWWNAPDMRPEYETTTDQATGVTKPVLDATTGKPVDAGHFWIYDGKQQATAIKPDAPPPSGPPG